MQKSTCCRHNVPSETLITKILFLGDSMYLTDLTDTNESKKKLTNLYKEVCKGLFGAGTTFLKIEINERFITFRTET